MSQNFNSKELKRCLKKGELYRNEIEESRFDEELDNIEKKIIENDFTFNF